jgi:hypothetical protein
MYFYHPDADGPSNSRTPPLEFENQASKNEILILKDHTMTVRPDSGAYFRRVTTSRTSSLDTVRPLYGFSGRTSFSLYCPPILRLLRLLGTT